MKQYDLVNQCLEVLKSSDIDMMEKLRLENLLIQMKMLLLVDVYKQETMPDVFKVHNFEELFGHVRQVCSSRNTPDAVKTLVEHVKTMHAAMAAFLNQNG